MKLTSTLALALVNLRGNPDFKHVLEGLKDHIAEESKICLTQEGTPLLRAQGGVKALQVWLDMNNDAPTVLEKFRSQQVK